MDALTEKFVTFAVSLAVGLLVGLEREHHSLTKAGVRTFALIALLGTLAAMVADHLQSAWIIPAAAIAITVTLAGAYFVDSRTAADDSGTTTVTAALGVYLLGVIVFFGDWLLAVTLGVAMTTLLHLKPELQGISRRLTAQDTRSMLQFAILTAVVLPLLPNQSYGPYGVLNPFQMWLMVVLISGVSLAGYIAWRLTLEKGAHAWRANLLLTGVLGGLVSSTATTLVFARNAKTGTMSAASSLVVIVLANATMFVRVLLLTAVVAPRALAFVASSLVAAALLATPTLIITWRRVGADRVRADEPYRNPTGLLVALAFSVGYGIVLLLSAWLSETLGKGALFGLASIAGLTDVDAITLSVLQLFKAAAVDGFATATAITLAVGANLVMKLVLVVLTGGAVLGRSTAWAFIGPLVGLAAGLAGFYTLG